MFSRLNNKRSIFQMINQLMVNHNYKKVLMFLKANNIETCNLKVKFIIISVYKHNP